MAKARSTALKVDGAWKAAKKLQEKKGLPKVDSPDQIDYESLKKLGFDPKDITAYEQHLTLVHKHLGRLPWQNW